MDLLLYGAAFIVVFSDKNPQRRRLVERWHRYVLKDNKTHDDLYPDDPAEKKPNMFLAKLQSLMGGKAKSAPAEAAVEEKKEAETASVVNPALLMDQEEKEEEEEEEGVMMEQGEENVQEEAQEKEQEEEEEKKKEEGEEEGTQAGAGGVWESISSTFWWLLGYKN